mgnify:CR=1 FL=1|jgi:hypothetical protein
MLRIFRCQVSIPANVHSNISAKYLQHNDAVSANSLQTSRCIWLCNKKPAKQALQQPKVIIVQESVLNLPEKLSISGFLAMLMFG